MQEIVYSKNIGKLGMLPTKINKSVFTNADRLYITNLSFLSIFLVDKIFYYESGLSYDENQAKKNILKCVEYSPILENLYHYLYNCGENILYICLLALETFICVLKCVNPDYKIKLDLRYNKIDEKIEYIKMLNLY